MTPPTVSLALFTVFLVVGFGWRSVEQRRRTGSTGFRGVSGRPGSLEWWAGVGFVLAIACAVLAPVLQMVGVVSPLAVADRPEVVFTGVLVAAAGIAATVYAQLAMGDSWRIGVDPGERTTLVRTGVFGLVRNPIFTAMIPFRLRRRPDHPQLAGDRRARPADRDDRTPGPHRRGALPAGRARGRLPRVRRKRRTLPAANRAAPLALRHAAFDLVEPGACRHVRRCAPVAARRQ